MNEELKKRLAALRALASARGATEAEAMAAAAKMAQIMAEHGLDDDDVEFDEAEAPLKTKRPTSRTVLIGTIATCTNCAATLKSDWLPCVIFLGKAPGPEIATYLMEVCDRAIDRAVDDFKTSPEYKRRRTVATRRQAVQDFTLGMVARLRQRLLEMFLPTVDDHVRADAVRVRDTRMPGTQKVRLPERKARFGNAVASGNAAGRDVQLAHGLNGGRSVQQIGRA